ncbi:MAG: DUF6946 family protein [Gemmatimonadaceae bacterium]
MGPSDWRRLIVDPQKQWKQTKSAYESAVAWEAARDSKRGLPPDIADLLDSQGVFSGASLLLAFPEHRVSLKGRGHASQTDLWALLSAPIGVVSVAVEAKAGEPFADTVADWLSGAKNNSGKPARLRQLCELWRVEEDDIVKCRYQLMHRPAAALLEAKRFQLNTALFLVHAFGDNDASLQDYSTWRRALGIDSSRTGLQLAGKYDGVDLWIGWVGSQMANHATVRAAV